MDGLLCLRNEAGTGVPCEGSVSSQQSDTEGEYAGILYDGILIKNDGKGKWWEGLNPQKLYVQNHPLSKDSEIPHSIHRQWGWENGATLPSEKYCLNFYNRTVDMINKLNPDLIYFDDTALPLWPVSNVGLEIAAHYYNKNMTLHNGTLEAHISMTDIAPTISALLGIAYPNSCTGSPVKKIIE